jgi:predicted permease
MFSSYHPDSNSDSIKYGSLFFTLSGGNIWGSSISAWMSNNVTPHARRATAVALVFIASNSGGILATWLLGELSPAPQYKSATLVMLVMAICMIVFSGANMAYLAKENQKKARTRMLMTREQEAKGLGDRSAWFIYNL